MKDCNYPRLFAYWILAYAVIFLVMFANFYVQAYRKQPAAGKGKDNQGNGSVTANGETSSRKHGAKHHKKH
jgi:elongation of very long chain fatty acids protein 7